MNSPSLSAEDLRTLRFRVAHLPSPLMASGATQAPPHTPIAPSKSADWRGRSSPRPPIFGCLLPRFPAIGNTCFPHAGHSSRLPSNRQLSFSITGQREPSGHQSPGSNVIQDSDFPWETTVRFFAAQKILPSPLVRRAAKQSVFFSPQNTNLVPDK